jgi:hypothetical protein
MIRFESSTVVLKTWRLSEWQADWLGRWIAHLPCAAQHAANDNIFIRWLFEKRLSCSKGEAGTQSVSQSEARKFFLAHQRLLLNPPCSVAAFVGSKLRAPHRGTSLSSCVWGANKQRPNVAELIRSFFSSVLVRLLLLQVEFAAGSITRKRPLAR